METARGYEFPVSNFQFQTSALPLPESGLLNPAFLNLQSTIADDCRGGSGTAPATKALLKKNQKKFLTAHLVGAKLPVIITSLVEVVNTQESGEAGAMRKQGKASRGSRRRYVLP